MKNIDVHSLKEWLDNDEALLLLDVREDWEFKNCNISGSLNIPLSEIQNNVAGIAEGTPIVLICHHGSRSFLAGMMLQNLGIKSDLYNLEGGIDAWARYIDTDMQRY